MRKINWERFSFRIISLVAIILFIFVLKTAPGITRNERWLLIAGIVALVALFIFAIPKKKNHHHHSSTGDNLQTDDSEHHHHPSNGGHHHHHSSNGEHHHSSNGEHHHHHSSSSGYYYTSVSEVSSPKASGNNE